MNYHPAWFSSKELEQSTNYQMVQFKRNNHKIIAEFLEALIKVHILSSWTVGRWDSSTIIACKRWEARDDARLP